MSANIFPCNLCPLREGCPLKAEFVSRIHGLGARSVAFPCPILEAMVRPGRRIVVKQLRPVDYGGGEDPGVLMDRVEVPATITSTSGHYRFACVVDPGAVLANRDLVEDMPEYDPEKFRFRKTMAHRRIVRFLDEPDATLCANGNVMRGDTCDRKDGGDFCPCRDAERLSREFEYPDLRGDA